MITISNITDARVDYIIQQKDDMGYWKPASIAKELDIAISNIRHAKQTIPDVSFRLIKRVIMDEELSYD